MTLYEVLIILICRGVSSNLEMGGRMKEVALRKIFATPLICMLQYLLGIHSVQFNASCKLYEYDNSSIQWYIDRNR